MDAERGAEGSFFQHGWQSWSVTGWRPPGVPVRLPTLDHQRLQAIDLRRSGERRPNGSGVGAVERDGEVTLKGALSPDAWVVFDDGDLVPNGPAETEWFEMTGAADDVFEQYAKVLGDRLGRRRASTGPVWCSWYAYEGAVTEELMLGVLDGLGDLAFDVVQIDDGWQQVVGDWHPRRTFPSGMKALAEAIGSTGRRPGVWLAPFLVDPTSVVARTYPDMILRDAAGDPIEAAHNWGGVTYALDVRRPDAIELIADVIERVTAEWGFEYLKLDFLYAAALSGEDDAESIYRAAMESIRETAGDAYLLACGAPVIASIGVADGLRVGPDTAPYWENSERVVHLHDRSGPGAADAIATSINRRFLASVIDVDPDVAFFRTKHNLLTDEQRALLADLALVCGFRGVSDPPDWLTASEREELAVFLSDPPNVTPLGHYEFRVGDRHVDFTRVIERRPW